MYNWLLILDVFGPFLQLLLVATAWNLASASAMRASLGMTAVLVSEYRTKF